MSRKKLTAKQHSFLEYLVRQVQETGVWPTYRQITDHFGYRSPNSVTQNLQALQKKGYLRRDESGYEFTEKVDLESDRPAGIPIRGTIKAGTFREVPHTDPSAITLSMLFPEFERIFAVRVAGQSMQEIEINDGDYVLLIDDDIPDGGIGAVLYDGEPSLRRVYHEEDGVRLEAPCDQHRNPQFVASKDDEISILGRYIGHVNANGLFRYTTGYFS